MIHPADPLPVGSRRSRRPRVRPAGIAIGAALAVTIVGCGFGSSSPSPAALPDATGHPSPSTSAPTESGAPPSAAASGPAVPPPSGPPASPGTSAASDPGLFAIVGGDSSELQFQYDPDTTASVAADPGVAKDATGIAIGLYTVRGQQPVADYGIVSVLQLRDPRASDEWFRSYRDSYDESACAQAGGVARHAQTELNGHTVFIAGCAGGAFTYHVRVRNGAIVVSITSVGPADLGTRLAGDVDRP